MNIIAFSFLFLSLISDVCQAFEIHKAIEHARKHNPDLLVLTEQLKQAENQLQQLKSQTGPQIHMVGSYTDQKILDSQLERNPLSLQLEPTLVPIVQDRYDLHWELRQVLFDLSYFPSKKALELRTHISDAEFERQSQEVTYTILQNYLELIRLTQLKQIQREEIVMMDGYLNQLQKHTEAGFEQKQNFLQEQANQASRKQEHLELKQNFQEQRLEFSRILGYYQKVRIAPKAFNQFPKLRLESKLKPQQLFKKALSRRIDYAQLSLLKEALQSEIASIDHERLPRFDFNANIGYLSDENYRFSSDDANWTLGISGRMPIFDSGQIKYRKQAVEIRLSEVLQQIENLKQSIKIEIIHALQTIQMREKIFEDSYEQFKHSRENLFNAHTKLQRKQSQQEEKVRFELLHTQALRQYVQSRFNLYQSYLDFYQALGEPKKILEWFN